MVGNRSFSGVDGIDHRRRHWVLFGGGYFVVLMLALLVSVLWLLLVEFPEPDLDRYLMLASCLGGAFVFAAVSAYLRGSIVVSGAIGVMAVLVYGLFSRAQLWLMPPPPPDPLPPPRGVVVGIFLLIVVVGGPTCALAGFVVGRSTRWLGRVSGRTDTQGRA